MAGGGAGASSSSSLPPLWAQEATPTAPPAAAAVAPAGGGQGGGPGPPPSPPPLTGGEFLLHLIQRSPQSRANPPSPPSSAASGRGRGGDHEDPAVAAVGPSVPFLHPPHAGGFPAGAGASASASPMNQHPHGTPPWAGAGAGAGYQGFHRASWAAPRSEFGSPRPPPPPGFHHHHHHQQYSHHYNKYNASQPAAAVPAFSPPLGFQAGPFDARDLHRNPGHSQHSQKHHHRQQQPRRDGFPIEGTPLVFGSLVSSGGGRLSHCDPFLPDKVNTASQGVQVRPDVLNAHSVAHIASTGYDHERERVLDSGRSFVTGSFPGSNWNLQPKPHQRPWHQLRGSGDRLRQKQQGSPLERSGKAEPIKLPCPYKKAKDVRKQMPSSNGRNGEHTLVLLPDLQIGQPRNLSCNKDSMLSRHLQPSTQVDHSSPSLQSETHSVLASDVNDNREDLHFNNVSMVQRVEQINDGGVGLVCINDSNVEQILSPEQLVDSLELTDEIAEKTVEVHVHASRGKDFRSDFSRGQHVLSQRIRNRRRELRRRCNIAGFTPSFLAIYESLIPSEEEKAKQRQLLQSLEKLVVKEWPHARLYLYGSCANSFGVSNSDIDVCLAIDENGITKSEILLKLADILQSDNLQNVQALTRARVPIVKLMDPVTGISCDICINNLLAVVNTKLLRDYAQIDDRLRQLAFIVKHWAKSRGVNDTYQGTLSSYAYVLMCIHFLQLRKPAILPCLQGMESTYVLTVDDIECAFFDQVEKLRDFGAENREHIAELLWAFFSYWAYHHDYANDVISVRTGGIMSKQSKDWTRRIGNDRHLICIEDPFELSHDLGRVVDKYTIRILREEFERAAEIMQYDPNPTVKLFEPYVRVSEEG